MTVNHQMMKEPEGNDPDFTVLPVVIDDGDIPDDGIAEPDDLFFKIPLPVIPTLSFAELD
jgi:hypothetical protein